MNIKKTEMIFRKSRKMKQGARINYGQRIRVAKRGEVFQIPGHHP
jgi:hypothetical protein